MGSIHNDSNGPVPEAKTITILVTGFGPFLERFPVNPSFEITKELPDFLPALKTQHTAVRIISHATPVRVAYEEVQNLVPRLLKTYDGTIDLVLHIGMASGRKHYALERYARREGYTRNKDVDGKMPSMDEGLRLFPDCPPVMTTSLDFDQIILNWYVNILRIPEGHPGAGADARPSEDAGRYLCDYLYFNSLAYCGRQSGAMEGGKCTDRPVLFFHVPPESDSQSLEHGGAVAVALIRAMADTLAQQHETNIEPVF